MITIQELKIIRDALKSGKDVILSYQKSKGELHIKEIRIKKIKPFGK